MSRYTWVGNTNLGCIPDIVEAEAVMFDLGLSTVQDQVQVQVQVRCPGLEVALILVSPRHNQIYWSPGKKLYCRSFLTTEKIAFPPTLQNTLDLESTLLFTYLRISS